MSMFCFQCEQTAFHKACTKKGVCGKEPDTANLQDELTSSVIELANCEEINDENTKLIIDGLFTTITNVNFDNTSIKNLTDKIKEFKIFNSFWLKRNGCLCLSCANFRI